MQEIGRLILMGEIQIVSAAIFLGVAAAISPGPLLALIVSETLKFGVREAVAASLSALFTDLPIFLFSYFVLYRESGIVQNVPQGFYALAGFILIYLGYKNIIYKETKIGSLRTRKGVIFAFLKGLSLNILNPYTYGFWFFIAINFYSPDFFNTLIFFVLFFVGFLVTKLIIITFVFKTKKFLNQKLYIFVINVIGVIFTLIGLNMIFLAIR